jgi:hypothetical protein
MSFQQFQWFHQSKMFQLFRMFQWFRDRSVPTVQIVPTVPIVQSQLENSWYLTAGTSGTIGTVGTVGTTRGQPRVSTNTPPTMSPAARPSRNVTTSIPLKVKRTSANVTSGEMRHIGETSTAGA